jgi:large repetitive protein
VWFSRSGTATNGVDYVSIGGSTATITIPAGASEAVLIITPIPDAVVEPPETVEVTIVPRATYLIGSPGTATVIIQDDLP